MGMDGMKNKCAVGIYKIEKKNVDAIDQRERRMEKMRLLLIHVVLLSVLLVGGSIGAETGAGGGSKSCGHRECQNHSQK